MFISLQIINFSNSIFISSHFKKRGCLSMQFTMGNVGYYSDFYLCKSDNVFIRSNKV